MGAVVEPIVETGYVGLTKESVLALLIGAGDRDVAARVRRGVEHAATSALYEGAAINDADPVLTMNLDYAFTRGELLALVHQLANESER